VIAAAVGTFGGVATALGATSPWPWISAGALWLFLILDCADGELARMRGGGSRLGQVLDGLSDYLVALTVHVGLLILAWRSPAFDAVPRWALIAIVTASGLCKAAHSALFDAAKMRFRRALGRNVPGMEPSEVLRAELAAAGTFRERLVLRIYMFYIGWQRTSGASKAEGERMTQARFLGWSLLGPTLRLSVILGVIAAFPFEPRALAIYPVFALVVANGWMIVMFAWARATRPSAP